MARSSVCAAALLAAAATAHVAAAAARQVPAPKWSTAGNMNKHVRYLVANPLPGHEGQAQNFTGEHFEVYSPPIRSRYSEVVWRTLPAVPLPEDIQARYKGSIMAVTGWEVDVVRQQGGVEVSVPCYESYNHHYTAVITSSKARISKRRGPDHGHGPEMLFDVEDGPAWIPQVQAFSEHNGNEARQSFHGLPRGFVQPIESPAFFVFNPMQINMRNPDGSGQRGGPLPRASAAPPNASYSGLLECPCSTRRKKVIGGPVTRASGQCGDEAAGRPDPWDSHSSSHGDWPLATAGECFSAAAALLGEQRASRNVTSSNASWPPGCSAVPVATGGYEAVFNADDTSTAQCGARGPSRSRGLRESLVILSLDVDENAGEVTISITGGDGKWFGVGFDATAMSDLPYAIVVDGYGRVTERKLEDHGPGRLLPATVRVLSNIVQHGNRTVVLKRALAGASPDYYSFAAKRTFLPFINALGGTADFGQHIARAPSAVALLEVNGPTCICRRKGGTIDGFAYDPQCADWPLSDLAKNKNPTCDVSTYVGGMACCRDGNFLLDADQEIPDYVDEVRYKWRFYFEDWDPKRHTQVVHLEWALNGCDSGGGHMGCRHIEYDVPRAPPGTPPEKAVHTVRSDFPASVMFTKCDPRSEVYCADPRNVTSAGVQLIMAGGHCHAPACLSLELWNRDTGELLCRVTPKHGSGDAAQDEAGYLWLPHCAWGQAGDGLRPPPVLHLKTNLTSVKRANSTYYHYGVMAIWQMRGAFLPAPGIFI